jgi:hypothetical protein
MMPSKRKSIAVSILVMSGILLACRTIVFVDPTSPPSHTPTVASTDSPTLFPASTSTPEPTSTPQPTATTAATNTPAPFTIDDAAFQDYTKDCNTDINITSVDGDSLGITVNTTLTMLEDGWAIFCYGAKHTWIGNLTYEGYTFASDENDPLQFEVTEFDGYLYINGSGTVTFPDGSSSSLP